MYLTYGRSWVPRLAWLKKKTGQECCPPISQLLRRQRKEDRSLEAMLGYQVRTLESSVVILCSLRVSKRPHTGGLYTTDGGEEGDEEKEEEAEGEEEEGEEEGGKRRR